MTSAAPDNASHYLYTFPSEVSADEHGAVALRWPVNAKPFERIPGPEQNTALAVVQARPDALTAEECDRVVALGESVPVQAGGVERGPGNYRMSHIAWLAPGPDTEWLYHRVAILFAEANRAYRFDIRGLVDAMQYTMYGAGQHFEWHLDLGPGSTSGRKLSMSIQLSEPDDYAGGQLEFVGRTVGPEARKRGTAVIFPAYLGHRVSPVDSGLRRSLVAWAYGPVFR